LALAKPFIEKYWTNFIKMKPSIQDIYNFFQGLGREVESLKYQEYRSDGIWRDNLNIRKFIHEFVSPYLNEAGRLQELLPRLEKKSSAKWAMGFDDVQRVDLLFMLQEYINTRNQSVFISFAAASFPTNRYEPKDFGRMMSIYYGDRFLEPKAREQEALYAKAKK
jgi:hypothetical protein